MKFVSWNVNGLRAAIRKGFNAILSDIDADLFAVQETKMQKHQKEFGLPGYHEYWNDAERKGYSGTLILAKKQPVDVIYGIGGEGYNAEGRVITLEYEGFFFVNAYVPNSKAKLARLDDRMNFENEMRMYLQKLDKNKPVIYCGDLNVAHQPIDLKDPDRNAMNPGYSDEERAKFTRLLDAGFVDVFRQMHPEKIQYTWWTYKFPARERNVGWRIDYFIVSKRLMDDVNDIMIRDDIYGSDHCPVELDIFD